MPTKTQHGRCYRVVKTATEPGVDAPRWDVIDASRRCMTCAPEGTCPGVTVATYATRAQARREANKREDDALTLLQPWATSPKAARAEATRNRVPDRLTTYWCVECLRSIGANPLPERPWRSGLCALCHYLRAAGLSTGDEPRDVCGVRIHPLDVPPPSSTGGS